MAQVTFINPLCVPEEREAEFLEKWDKGAAYVRERDGFVSTSLHKSLNPQSRFQFFTVAVWESAEQFYGATGTDWWREYTAGFGFGSGPSDFAAFPTLCTPVR
jgi:heme-degrading monooxygenase HmoA